MRILPLSLPESAIIDAYQDSPTSKAIRSFDCIVTLNNLNLAFKDAIENDDYQELDYIIKIIQNSKTGHTVDLDINNNYNAELQNFLVTKLHLNLENNKDKQVCDFLVKFESHSIQDLVLIVLSANDKLTKKYKDFLFSSENVGILPIIVAGNTYVKILLKKLNQDCTLLESLRHKLANEITEFIDKRLYSIVNYSKPVIDVLSSEKFTYNDNECDKTLVSIRTLFKQKHTKNNESFLDDIHTLFVERPDNNIKESKLSELSKLIVPIVAVSTTLAVLVLLNVIGIELAALIFSVILTAVLYNNFSPDQNLQNISIENQKFKVLGKS